MAKHRNIEASKHRIIEASSYRNIELSNYRNYEAYSDANSSRTANSHSGTVLYYSICQVRMEGPQLSPVPRMQVQRQEQQQL